MSQSNDELNDIAFEHNVTFQLELLVLAFDSFLETHNDDSRMAFMCSVVDVVLCDAKRALASNDFEVIKLAKIYVRALSEELLRFEPSGEPNE